MRNMRNKTKRKAKVVSDKQLAGLRAYNKLRHERAQLSENIREDVATLHTTLEVLMENIHYAYKHGVDVGLAGYNADGKRAKPKAI